MDNNDDKKDSKGKGERTKAFFTELLVKHLMQVSLSDSDIGSGKKHRHVTCRFCRVW